MASSRTKKRVPVLETADPAELSVASRESAAAPEPGRLDQVWTALLAHRPVARSRIQEWIKAGLARVDGQSVTRPSHKLGGGEALTLDIPEARDTPAPEQGGLHVLYRDAHLLVLDKPPGLTVHPAPSCPEGTLVNRLLHHFPELARIEGQRPGIVHRIDKDTSGLLAVALHEAARLRLSEAFAGREVSKTYLALVHGRPARDVGSSDAPIGRDPSHKTRMCVQRGGREAHSRWRVAWSAPSGRASLLEVEIDTGRTHQIRVHLAHAGHPLLGDVVYASREQAELKRSDPLLHKLASRQMLHAWKLGLPHPAFGSSESEEGVPERLDFVCPPPGDFWRVLLHLGRGCQRVGVVGLPGSGKSALLSAFEARGLPAWSADRYVAALYEPGRDGANLLRSRFGERFVPEARGGVDKAALLAAMRASESLRREVMELLYPVVRGGLEDFWREQTRVRVAFAEVPMLLEAGWTGAGAVDLVVGVDCPDDLRHQRLRKKRGWDDALSAQVDSWQWPREKKLAACAFVVENASDLAAVDRAAARLLRDLAGLRRAGVASLLAWMRVKGYCS
ncbi:dephospho-CoA kinase [Fundidesulfovibrio magnetotacticus]|nr:dephospho-CoA kinase [Fundidesulfovibrio magnetotacticus]